jgi:hypothetical protein
MTPQYVCGNLIAPNLLKFKKNTKVKCFVWHSYNKEIWFAQEEKITILIYESLATMNKNVLV